MTKKLKAVTETNVKTIINMDKAALMLDKTDMAELHRIINLLKKMDEEDAVKSSK